MSEICPDDEASLKGTRDWPHAPPHRLGTAGVYFVTSRTHGALDHFHSPERRTLLRDTLLALASHYRWKLEAWAVLSNHYHFVAHSPTAAEAAASLRHWLKHLHADTARLLNQMDHAAGRKIWHNFRETHLTFQKSYLSRLHYTHANAVHHGLTARATDYPWCSAADFVKACTPSWVRTIRSFAFDEIAAADGE